MREEGLTLPLSCKKNNGKDNDKDFDKDDENDNVTDCGGRF